MSEPVTPLVHTDEAALSESTASGAGTVQMHCGACSSAVERHVHIVDVTGSIPVTPTVPDLLADLLADDVWRMRVEERFWPKVMRPLSWDECWLWTGKVGVGRRSYGNIKITSYQTVRTHRLSYALYYGKSPGDLFVCHKCDNPTCVNPTHLFLGTNADNMADMVAKGRAPRRDQRGALNGAAKLTPAQVETIRGLISAGMTNTAIAPRFGVTHQLISKIRRGGAWGEPPMQKPYASLRR